MRFIDFRNLLFLCSFVASSFAVLANRTSLHYKVSFSKQDSHSYNVQLQISNFDQDSIILKMPNWMPGYYQLLYYARSVQDFKIDDSIPYVQKNENTWTIYNTEGRLLTINYTIQTQRKFVANSYVDAEHAYIVPGNTFLYIQDHMDLPVQVTINMPNNWNRIATGLEVVNGMDNTFSAQNFDILFDCPILIGNLEQLPSFEVQGVPHHFIGYRLGDFDQNEFMDKLKQVVESSISIIGDIPFEEYTFIGIGPGRGGIEHLNNSTVSFSGNNLDDPDRMTRMLSFLAHEYFHHYNVKRIRPYELGPFDYDAGSRTNLLCVSEGFTSYFESIILKRAGLIDSEAFLDDYASQITTLENDPGRAHQSVAQASFSTWEEGPFGGGGDGPDRSISVYNKGTVLGLILDLAIRSNSNNENSLTDVMRHLYWHFYKEKDRGFTDAEFREVCEMMAGQPLTEVFEYIYTTRPIDYDTYLGNMGLILDNKPDDNGRMIYSIQKKPHPTDQELELQSSWMQEE